MTALTRWDPFSETVTMRNMMERLFDEPFFQAPRLWERSEEWNLALDVTEDENEFVIKASTPGVSPEDVEITLSDNLLTIKGEMKEEKETEEKNYHLRERHYGKFMRSITLPVAVEADRIEAVNENGVLTVHLPKAEAVKPKRITIKPTVNGG
ncbi:MAG: Hsp20/alpha crystallin family protein [Caldilineaceae bacterium]|nr:Hsp20/alpha crystallin family protein [Caldilineaceae bacterium]